MATIALDSGRTIRSSVPYVFSPSTAAASSSSTGRLSKNAFITSRLNTFMALGRAIAQTVFFSPRLVTRT